MIICMKVIYAALQDLENHTLTESVSGFKGYPNVFKLVKSIRLRK